MRDQDKSAIAPNKAALDDATSEEGALSEGGEGVAGEGVDIEPAMIEAFSLIAQHTLPKCGACTVPYGCCATSHCEEAMAFAAGQMGVTLEPTGHPTLPLMGPGGCTAAPHLRPLCSIHACDKHFAGGDDNWIQKYCALRDEASDRLEEHFAKRGA